jgi:hypothetical protein
VNLRMRRHTLLDEAQTRYAPSPLNKTEQSSKGG